MDKKKKAIIEELHKPARKNFIRRRVITTGMFDLWQTDLIDIQKYADENENNRFILIIIDVFSKYAWAIPINTKTGQDVTNAFKIILSSTRAPKNLQSDDGREFFNSSFKTLMKKYKINHYSTYSPLKASVVERLIRTIKSKLYKAFTYNKNHEVLDILPKIMKKYNNTKHRTIQMKPVEVCKKNEKRILQHMYGNLPITDNGKFKVGQQVRISKYKHHFEKGYTPNYTTEIFTIIKKQRTFPVTYILENYLGEPIHGGFYEEELIPVKYSNEYIIEKVLEKKPGWKYVKWLGFDESHNSWISA